MKYISDIKNPMHRGIFITYSVIMLSLSLLHSASALARSPSGPPALIITNEPLPLSLQGQIYNYPVRTPVIDPADISGDSYFNDSRTTLAGKKIQDLNNELFSMHGLIADLSERLASLENEGRLRAADYYASVATIRTQLQSGTTPGNPRLVERLSAARGNLEYLGRNIAHLNDLAVEISNTTSMVSFLLESARATYALSGAVEEDHVRLAQLEDAVNNSVVVIDRLLNNVNDDITRTMAYLSTERANMRTLSLAVTSGDLFGRSLSNIPFAKVKRSQSVYGTSGYTPAVASVGMVPTPVPAVSSGLAGGARPLVKIRFDHPNVAYEQPLYVAINTALQRFPNAQFELIAVHPSRGNAAQVSIESTRSRRNAERVLRSLTQMGLTMDRVDLSYAPSQKATSSEVHLYIR